MKCLFIYFVVVLFTTTIDRVAQFARTFGLDLDLVNRVRTTTLLDAADKNPASASPVAIRAALDIITDLEFVVDSCLQASCPTLADTVAMLEYATFCCGCFFIKFPNTNFLLSRSF